MSIVTFYRGDPNAPKTTQGARLGANAIITCNGKLLLEKRRDCDMWGLVGGGVKKQETPLQAIAREIQEELGLRIPQEQFRKLAVYGEPGRIAAYKDGHYTTTPTAPCGACRQVILETEHRYKQPIELILYGEEKTYIITSIESLLPLCFGKTDLE